MSDTHSPDFVESKANPYFIGHEIVENIFLESWNGGRVAHSWLICGQRGIGKSLLAYRLARFALNHKSSSHSEDLFEELPSCNSLQMSEEHNLFRRTAALGHTDFRVVERGWVDAKKNKRKSVIGVDDVRTVRNFLAKTPAEGGWRVVLIDAADEMNINAANAVLKILEEPPSRSLILLIAHHPDRLLPTIRSRCRRLDLRPLKESQVADLLLRYCPNLNTEELSVLTILAQGSIGKALELVENGGASLFRELMSTLGNGLELNINQARTLADKVSRGDTFRTLSSLILWWLARIAAFNARGILTSFTEVVPGEQNLASMLMSTSSPASWAESWLEIQHISERTLALHLDRKRSLILMLNTIVQTANGVRSA